MRFAGTRGQHGRQRQPRLLLTECQAELGGAVHPALRQPGKVDLRVRRPPSNAELAIHHNHARVVDAYQIYEARSFGADAALLIAAVLPKAALADLQALTQELGMAALMEVHTDEELEAVLATRPALVGINNRNLKTLQTTLEVSRRLRPRIPEGVTVVAESGIEERAQVEELERLGVHAVLVGTALMRAADPAVRVRELLGAAG